MDAASEDEELMKCPSCGVPYVNHLGMTGTCAKLQAIQKYFERLVPFVEKIRNADRENMYNLGRLEMLRQVSEHVNNIIKSDARVTRG